MEALKISETPPETLMNSKSEWGSNSVPWVVVEQEIDKERNSRDKSGTKRTVLNRDMDPGDRPKRKRPNCTQNSKWSKKISDDLKPTFQSIESYFVSNSLNSPSASGMESNSK